MISVPVPKDLSQIKTKVIWNLTKRQLICFGLAGLVGIPLYLFLKGYIGTEPAALLMVVVMLPFFFIAMYERDGMPAEKVLYLMIRQRFIVPGIRANESENIIKKAERKETLESEVKRIEKKAK